MEGRQVNYNWSCFCFASLWKWNGMPCTTTGRQGMCCLSQCLFPTQQGRARWMSSAASMRHRDCCFYCCYCCGCCSRFLFSSGSCGRLRQCRVPWTFHPLVAKKDGLGADQRWAGAGGLTTPMLRTRWDSAPCEAISQISMVESCENLRY